MPKGITEEELSQLIQKTIDGDRRSFEMIVRSFQRYTMTIAFRILCDENDARDVVQEGFIRVWRHIGNYNPAIKFSTWLYKIIVNLSIDRLKSRKNLSRFFFNSSEEIEPVDFRDMEKDYSNRETAGLIKFFAGKLPEKQRVIFVLRDLEELSVSEVVEITGLSESSVKTNLFHARRSIREKIIGYENEK